MVRFWDDRESHALYLSREAIKMLKDRGVSPSKLINEVLIIIVQEKLNALEYVDLATYQSLLKHLKADEGEYLDKLDGVRRRIIEIEDKIAAAKLAIKDLENAEAISRLIRSLNQKIRKSKYKLERIKVRAREEIKELENLGLPITDEWLERQARRVKILL